MSKYKQGTSGNPAGRKKNVKTRKTLITESLDAISLERNIDVRKAIVEKMVNMSLDGDMISARLLLERLEPAYKPTSAPIELQQRLPTDLLKKSEKILSLAASGDINIDAAKDLLTSVGTLLKVSEHTTLTARIEALEEQLKNEK